MEEQHLIILDKTDLELAGKIIKHIDSVSTPEDAVKWALKQCSTRWPGTADIIWDFDVPHLTVPESSTPTLPEPIKLGKHDLAYFKLPMEKLSGLSGTVLIASQTLRHLAADETQFSDIANNATIAKMSMK